MTKTIGVIGLGSIGARHSKNLRELGHHVIAYDPLMSGKLGSWTLEQVLADAEAIVIASPTPDHLDHLVMAVLAGKPCLIEKPIASWMGKPPRNLANALHVAERDKIPLMVGYNLRFHSCVKKAKEWLDAGLIGNPLWANFTLGQYSEKPPYLRDGVILNWSHEIDLAIYLLGAAKVAASSTRVSRPGEANSDVNVYMVTTGDDMTDILLTHESGCRSTVHLDYITNPEQRYFTITGDKGRIIVDVADRIVTLQIDNKVAESHRFQDTWNDNYIEEMQAFISRIDGKKTIGCTGKEGLEVLKICLEVRKQAGLE